MCWKHFSSVQLKVLYFLLFLNLSVFSQTDPNINPNWDWINGDYPQAPYPSSQYKMYIETANGIIQESPRNAPWNQGNAWIGLQDMRKEDGWVLISRDFGTPWRAIYAPDQKGSPYFILYNKYRGILRFFMWIRTGSAFSSGAIQIEFDYDNSFKTATLSLLKPRSYATDKVPMVANNVGSALTIPMEDNWCWADFPMAYDPTFTPSIDGAWLNFQVLGTTESDVKISGTATGINGTQKEVRDFLTGTSNGSVAVSSALPSSTEAGNNSISFEQFHTKVFGTASNWDKWKVSIQDLYKKLPIMENPSYVSPDLSGRKNQKNKLLFFNKLRR